MVLFFALLLTSSIATFLKRSTIDYMVSRHREDAAQAEAVARGGVQIALALILDDKVQKELPVHTGRERWATARNVVIEIGDGAVLRLSIQDTGSKVNLNSLYEVQPKPGPGELPVEGFLEDRKLAEPALRFLTELLGKTIDEMDITPAEKALYDVAELAENLADYLDGDEERQRGGREDDFYEEQNPPYTARNGPLLSVAELRRVEGFTLPLVKALSNYVTVYPYAGGGGINPNTAPPHVLALLFSRDEGSEEVLADKDIVHQILDVRQDEGVLCPQGENSPECTPIDDPFFRSEIFPPLNYRSSAFIVHSKATVGEIERTVETVIDITQPSTPWLLSWQLR